MKHENICIVILAGGLSSRMGGGLKSFNYFNNRTIFDRVIQSAKTQSKKIIINSNVIDNKFEKYDLPIIKDKFNGYLGPLAGIHTALSWVKINVPNAKWLVSIPSDTPFIPNDLASKFFTKTFNSNSKIIIAKNNNKIHPVIGLWSLDLLQDLEKSLNNGIRKIMFWVKKHSFETQNFEHKFYDPFFNINYKEDLILAKDIEDKYIL